MEFIELLIILSEQPLAWMCFFLGMAVFSLLALFWTVQNIVRQRRAAADEFRANFIDRQINLQREQERRACMLRWQRADLALRMREGR